MTLLSYVVSCEYVLLGMHGVRNGSENVFAASKSTDVAADRSERMQACSTLESASAHVVDVVLFYPT